MDRFEFFFGIYSLLLGFAIAELMLGYANPLRAPARPAWGWLTPTLSLLIFLEIMTSFLDAWVKLQQVELNLVGLLTPTLVAVAYFVAAVMAVPRRATEVHTEWVIANIIIVGLHAVPIFTRNRWGNLLPPLGLIVILFYYYGNFTPSMFGPAPTHAPAPVPASGS